MILSNIKCASVETSTHRGATHTQSNKHAHIHYLDRPAAGKLILGLVVWVARCGLGSSAGVKELSSVCYHPADWTVSVDPKAAFTQQPAGMHQNWGGRSVSSRTNSTWFICILSSTFSKFCSLCLEENKWNVAGAGGSAHYHPACVLFVKTSAQFENCFLLSVSKMKYKEGESRKGEGKKTCRPDWIRERACFSSPCQCTPAAG